MKKGINWKILLACFLIVFASAFIGSMLTDTGEWYEKIKPSITPPNYVFPIVWNILFFLLALSLYFAWASGKKRKKVAFAFGINLALNIFWSFLYFTLKIPLYSFIEIFFLLASIVYMIIVCWKISRKSSYLLFPYLVWVGFASILNYLSLY